MPKDKKSKGIVAQQTDKMQSEKPKPSVPGKPHAPAKTDQQLIAEALSQIGELKDAQNVVGRERINRGFVRIYDLSMTVKQQPRNYVAFVYPIMTFDAAEFIAKAAYTHNIVGLALMTPTVTIMKNYKG